MKRRTAAENVSVIVDRASTALDAARAEDPRNGVTAQTTALLAIAEQLALANALTIIELGMPATLNRAARGSERG